MQKKFKEVVAKVLHKVIEERRRLGISQAELARRAGLPQPLLCHLERGQSYPWPKYRRMISAALGLSESQLFEEGSTDGDKTV